MCSPICVRLGLALVLAFPALLAAQVQPKPQPPDDPAATHKFVSGVEVKGATAQNRLQTLCSDGQDRIIGLVALAVWAVGVARS